MKTCAARIVVCSPKSATVGLDDRLADTKSHTGAVRLGCKESVEYLAGLVWRKSDASIIDRHQKLFVALILRAESELAWVINGLHSVDAVHHKVH